MCVNSRTGAVVYTGKLICSSGSRALQIGAQGPAGSAGSDGAPGPQGPQGPQSPQGLPGIAGSSTEFFAFINPIDIAGTVGVTSFSALTKKIVAVISPNNLSGLGTYQVRADLRGIWTPQTSTGSFLECYFQNASDYPTGGVSFGEDSTTNDSWNSINLHVFTEPSDFSLSKSSLYLVCATNGTISGLKGVIVSTAATNLINLQLGTPPTS
jgi:hypothetical protein